MNGRKATGHERGLRSLSQDRQLDCMAHSAEIVKRAALTVGNEQTIEFAFEIGVPERHVAFAAAPEDVVGAAEFLGHFDRLLHLGCGEGELLAWLKENKQVDGRGVEMEGARVQKAISRGASVYQGDLETAVDDPYLARDLS